MSKKTTINYKEKARLAKSQVTYPPHAASGSQIHDAPHAVEYAMERENRVDSWALGEEQDLEDKLLAEVADNGADVRELCETYQLKREELGRLTGFSLRALAEWAGGKLPSQPARRRLQEVRRLLDALAQIVKPGSIPAWLHRSNSAFDRLTPLQLIEIGQIDRLWAMVHDLGSGQPE
jgi:DNA-binding transcriptional regulator YiaG